MCYNGRTPCQSIDRLEIPSMRLRNKIILLLIPQLVLCILVSLNDPDRDSWGAIEYVFLASLSYLLALESYFLCKGEPCRGTGVVFLNLAIFFGCNAILSPVFDLVSWCFLQWSRHVYTYFSQYFWLLYFMLLALSVVYLLVDAFWKTRTIYEKYIIALLIVGGVWGYLFYPYLLDSRYLSKKQEFVDYLAVQDAMTKLRADGNENPSMEEIVAVADLRLLLPKVNDEHVPWTDKQKRVLRTLPYLKGGNFGTLYWRPLYKACSWMGMFCTFMVLTFIVFQYLKDPPREAYLEKIVWCLLFYCSFEGLHLFAYSTIAHWDTLQAVVRYGRAFSIGAMLVLLFLLAVRLKFIRTVEGGYYERRLIDGADSITRWRDAFDNWVLRQFMDPKELDRRFVIRRNTESDLQD